MIEETIEQARNPDIANSLIALKRAARMARELAVRTNTAIVVVRDGRWVRITAEELRASGVR